MYNKNDKIQAANLMIFASKAKLECTGMDIVLLADSLRWLAELDKKIGESLNPKVGEIKQNPIKVSEVAKSIEISPKKSKKAE